MANYTVTTLDDETSAAATRRPRPPTAPGCRCARRWRSPTATARTRHHHIRRRPSARSFLTNGQLEITTDDITIDGDIDGDSAPDITIMRIPASAPTMPPRVFLIDATARRSPPRSTASSFRRRFFLWMACLFLGHGGG